MRRHPIYHWLRWSRPLRGGSVFRGNFRAIQRAVNAAVRVGAIWEGSATQV